ncbi:hypothetical protein A3H10_03165 [Candidatus Uhrbacteria bacterium RIFCSPLOWO2_12_FULL_46_10]|uniref:2-oxoacid:ferredoxin oxidoreductase subunit alpha n=1 Tax=Candidatus Uhrbacteria bacterium RIFCSPLOWO2_01_FULL_47_25 TaxID=1802402 RepID=A0A1F7UXR4_9BACT|nr:MAG: hypothetical protein A2752_02970 [Candidatus Uhrbacteria bacterium RIFCSPHIGHO2_01_FULL_46_23]OGL70522.1 MAG: hypothetical protein A3D60_03540 [Candidatus Uhrbacteria bacterium RIFCSPHIGHO2_02_FULL_47_29]OGL75143.1 MAG: hypothetical protein A3E96_04370 [Candidatus Uhrbacteria bacterium RIFCSPHIGHO2_12_FULL_46_13]OGL83055.1 MAG: hypothetical protein A2936_05045 [Candidatus Uhrbacteria bacterium RIFCSPLOWO2_01_FULL_47_25]OGL84145.1 MAG: hypothetical protein A3I37_03155 [Candidatus Uhrbact
MKTSNGVNKQKIFSLKIGGYAGQGVKAAGLMFAKVATRSGFNIYDYIEYPSLIRGGHNVIQICVSSETVTAPSQKTDLLIAFNQDTVNKHASELLPGAGLMFDEADKLDISKVNKKVEIYRVPFAELTRESGGKKLMGNTVAIGATIALLGGDLEILKNLITDEFKNKGAGVVAADHKAAESGYNYVKENFSKNVKKNLALQKNAPAKMIVTGNEAVALGAIAAGLEFAAIYPMSPITNILHTLAAYQEKFGYIYKQPEDEISAINMAIGASFAGARSMTATSGGGFCLMTEGFGLAGMTETPVVIINGMRGGPATGLPTWSEQGDLRFALHAHQGDFPRIVLAAGDAKEAFDLTMQAFNLADKYQTPVALLIDKNICENDQSFPFFDISSYRIDRGKFITKKQDAYQRYAPTKDGISVRTVPGSGNHFIANSDEHDLIGYSTEEISDRNVQMEKRMLKLKTCAGQDMPAPIIFGPAKADLTIVSWGSNKGSILEAIKNYKNVNFLHLTWLSPFPTEVVKKILSRAKKVIDIEANYSAQLRGLIKEQTGLEIKDTLLKYDGRPFSPEEIREKIDILTKVRNRTKIRNRT